MRFEKRRGADAPCGPNCGCYETMRIVVVKDDGTVINNYADRMAFGMYELSNDSDAADYRYAMARAFLERAYAKQQARIEQQQGAAVLESILNESAFSFIDTESGKVLQHEIEGVVRVMAYDYNSDAG